MLLPNGEFKIPFRIHWRGSTVSCRDVEAKLKATAKSQLKSLVYVARSDASYSTNDTTTHSFRLIPEVDCVQKQFETPLSVSTDAWDVNIVSNFPSVIPNARISAETELITDRNGRMYIKAESEANGSYTRQAKKKITS